MLQLSGQCGEAFPCPEQEAQGSVVLLGAETAPLGDVFCAAAMSGAL